MARKASVSPIGGLTEPKNQTEAARQRANKRKRP
jgi:hypothetical protein